MVLDEIAAEVAERGSANWDPAAPLSLTFVAEEGAADRYGSYFVFRKLEQNVRRYRDLTIELAGTLGVTEDFASALVVGRHRDGTPIVPFTQPAPGADPNDFDFSSDRPLDGSAARLCPFHAHIRRSNPRGDLPAFGGPSAEFERSMRIARRGMTYGNRPDLDRGGEPPEMGVGLLFMSFQANLRQFAIQQAGSDSEDFPFEAAGLEGLTGRALGDPAPQSWPVSDPADPGAARPFRLLGFVKMLGGEYFFAPSLSTLRSLMV
jgi:deferrochelatase/peroxidase EfeB